MNDDKRGFKFNAIYVLESLNDDEIQTGEILYKDIIRYIEVKIGIIKCRLFKINSKGELKSIFKVLRDEVDSYGTFPFLHFEIHGSKEGFVLNSKELVSWMEITELLREINIKTRNNIVVSLATCYGAYIYSNIWPSLPSPFFAFVGPWNTVTSDEIMVSFTRFFEFIYLADDLQAVDFDLAVEKMNENNGLTEKFGFYLAEIVYDRIVFEYEEDLKNPDEFEKRVNGMVEFGLRIEGITNKFTIEEMRKLVEMHLRNPLRLREKQKAIFLCLNK